MVAVSTCARNGSSLLPILAAFALGDGRLLARHASQRKRQPGGRDGEGRAFDRHTRARGENIDAELLADQPGVVPASSADVDVVDVAAGAGAEDGDEAVAEFAAQLGGEVPGIVGGILGAADGIGVQGEHAQRADRLLVLREQDEGEIGIDRASRPHDLRIEHAGIEADAPVFQVEPAVEREPIVLRPHQLHRRRRQPRIGVDNHVDQPVAQRLGIVHGGERILSVFRCRLFAEDPGPFAREERPGVRVRGGDRDVRCGNARARGCPRTHVERHGLRHPQQIAHDERRARRTLLKHQRLGLERILLSGRQTLGEVPVHAIADRRGDVDLGQSHLQ